MLFSLTTLYVQEFYQKMVQGVGKKDKELKDIVFFFLLIHLFFQQTFTKYLELGSVGASKNNFSPLKRKS